MTDRQHRFIELYLQTLNATEAYKGAYGISNDRTAASNGNRLLRNADVAAKIAAAQQERAERARVDADYVVGNLTEIAERCMERAPVMVRKGREWVQKTDEEGRSVWQFDARGANKALELLGKHLGIFKDRVAHEGADGGPVAVAVTHEIIDPASAR